MLFSLLTDFWIPVRRASGAKATVRPCDINDAIDVDPIVALDWPRPDFRLAGMELLIGLLATACPPADDDDGWLDWYETPPDPATLDAAFAPLAAAFVLDGDGPRFMQDFSAAEFTGEPNRIETLLIDAPGGQTLKKNADHFVKRATIATMGRAAAAIALYTLQTDAPAGGAGNRVGLRGGGPMVTLAIPPSDGTLALWRLLWANVPTGTPARAADLPRIFPWLAPTRTSEANRITTPADVDPRQAFWGMPRRIRLDFAEATGERCMLDGSADTVVARGWRQRPYGANYATWDHPLTPYYRQKSTDPEWLPLHPQPGGIGYRHFLGLLLAEQGNQGTRRVAACVTTFRTSRLHQIAGRSDRVRWRMLAAGFDMDNMKARGFVESELPVVEPGDPQRTTAFVILLGQVIAAATEACRIVGGAVRRALFSDGATVPLEAGLLADVRARFWDWTEDGFQRIAAAAAGANAEVEAIRREWLGILDPTARALFAEAAPIDANGADRRPDRIAHAARSLDLALRGIGKDGAALWTALGLPVETKPKKAAKGSKQGAKP